MLSISCQNKCASADSAPWRWQKRMFSCTFGWVTQMLVMDKQLPRDSSRHGIAFSHHHNSSLRHHISHVITSPLQSSSHHHMSSSRHHISSRLLFTSSHLLLTWASLLLRCRNQTHSTNPWLYLGKKTARPLMMDKNNSHVASREFPPVSQNEPHANFSGTPHELSCCVTTFGNPNAVIRHRRSSSVVLISFSLQTLDVLMISLWFWTRSMLWKSLDFFYKSLTFHAMHICLAMQMPTVLVMIWECLQNAWRFGCDFVYFHKCSTRWLCFRIVFAPAQHFVYDFGLLFARAQHLVCVFDLLNWEAMGSQCLRTKHCVCMNAHSDNRHEIVSSYYNVK